jgi:3-oxoacyl-[acyl-carrier-protein] synthase II
MPYPARIAITGVGLTSPIGNDLAAVRRNLLAGVSGVTRIETRYMEPVLAGVCSFDTGKYQSKKDARRGTRAGSIAVYCAREAIADGALQLSELDRTRIGVYLGISEHGNVETENEIFNIKGYDYDVKFWSHHQNPRTVANSPAGEITLNLSITGPHYTIGAACAAGNAAIIQGMQMLQLGEVDVALAGGVSESIHTFGTFASFKAQGALATHAEPTKASRPFDRNRNGIVVSEGGCIFVLERLDTAVKRKAKVYAEIVGHAMNSDAFDFVLPAPKQQQACIELAMNRAGMQPSDIHLVSTHATGTLLGDVQECIALRNVFADIPTVHINNTKSFIGHAMGAAGALELAGNLPSLVDGIVHPTINVDELDPECALDQLVIGVPLCADRIDSIMNISAGMLGANAVLIVQRLIQ